MTAIAHARLRGAASQGTFDVLMRTMAEPGIVRQLPARILVEEVPAAAWPLLALADVDVNISVDDDENDPTAALIADATGATIATLSSAWAALVTSANADLIRRVAIGDALHPEHGARLAIAVDDVGDNVDDSDDLNGPTAMTLLLSGAGVDGTCELAVAGLDPAVAAMLGRASGPFPAGFDVWLIAPTGHIAGIPRSTSIEIVTSSGGNAETGSV